MTSATAQPPTLAIPYGCDTLAPLRSVLLHTPGPELELVTAANHRRWLFDAVPDYARFREEHLRYRELLERHGVHVYELASFVKEHAALMGMLPNLTYLHDCAVISCHGALLSKMAFDGRRNEERVVREALTALGIPILHEFRHDEDAFEGCLLLSPQTLMVCDTERHSPLSIVRFVEAMSTYFDEILYVAVPKSRRFMHPDTVFNRISDRLALYYPGAIEMSVRFRGMWCEKVDFHDYMRGKGLELLAVSDDEQRRLACSFVPLRPDTIVHYDTALDAATRNELDHRGVELVLFHPDALIAGGGSLRCLTLRLHRA